MNKLLSSSKKISTRQAVILSIMIVYSSAIRVFPTNAAKLGGRAGWLTPVFAIIPFVLNVYIIQAFFKNNKEANLSDIILRSLGKVFGTALLTLYVIWTLISLGIHVRYFSEKFLTSLLPNTPLNFFLVTILAAVFYATRRGIVYIARTGELLFTFFTIAFTVLFLLCIPNVEIINLFPITPYDILPLLKSSYTNIGIWGAFTFVFFIGDEINDKEHIKRFGLQGAVYMLITAMMILIQTIGSYGHSVIQRISMPYVFVIKSIALLETIERIESVAVASWVVIDFVAISVILYFVAGQIKAIFSLSEMKPIISPITIFAFIFSQYVAQNRFEMEKFSNNISLFASITFGFVFLPIIFIIAKIRKKI